MGLKGLSGAEAGRVYAARFEAYIEERKSKNALPWGADGRLVREAMARDLGFRRDVFRTNPVIKKCLEELEAGAGRATEAAGIDAAASGRRTPAEALLASTVDDLRSRCVLLEEENRELRRQLALLRHMDLELPASGRFPW